MTNYVSFSLWGNSPIYNVGAIKNAQLMDVFYPDWKMIVFYDNSVPQSTIDKLSELGVVLRDMTGNGIYGMFWRFFAHDESDCEYVVFRDTDSRISEREKMAVDEWIRSGKSIHVMRDHPAHKIPYGNNSIGILGGMWGIKSNIIPLTDMIKKYPKSTETNYGNDQAFLKNIYNIFKEDNFTHDDFFEKKPFPIKRIDQRFIGERINIDEQPLTNDWMQIP